MTHLSIERIRHGERTVDPAEGINHMRRYAIHNATDRLPHILRGRNDQTAGEQQYRGEWVMETEDRIIRLYILPLKVALQATQ